MGAVQEIRIRRVHGIKRETRQKLADADTFLRSKNQMISMSTTMYQDREDLAQTFISKVTGHRDAAAHSFLLCSSLDLATYASCDQP